MLIMVELDELCLDTDFSDDFDENWGVLKCWIEEVVELSQAFSSIRSLGLESRFLSGGLMVS